MTQKEKSSQSDVLITTVEDSKGLSRQKKDVMRESLLMMKYFMQQPEFKYFIIKNMMIVTHHSKL